jgi:putative ABC transport system ATP-binding protein
VGSLALLELQAVAKHFDRGTERVVALAGVDLAVGEGEAVALVGPSGSGKSTLLHLAGGLDTPDGGTVRVGGVDVASLSTAERARLRRRDIGFVFQFFHLLPTLSVAENVELPLLLDRRRRGRRQRVAEVLDQVGVAHRSSHLPGELSGGEMQRVAVARALVCGPRLVLADEPTGNLDSVTGRAVLDLLSSLVASTGTALLMVTHDESAAARTGRVVHLRDGRLADPLPPGDGEVATTGGEVPTADGARTGGSAGTPATG